MIIALERFLPIVDKDGLPTLRASSFFEELVRVEDSHEVGATGEPAFQNSWVNFSPSDHETAGFYMDNFNRVWLKGLIKLGSGTIFTLPKGYRPSLNANYSSIDGTGTPSARIQVYPTGDVRVLSGNNSFISLDGMSFRV